MLLLDDEDKRCLLTFFGGYFYQGWNYEGEEWEDPVREYLASGNDLARLVGLLREASSGRHADAYLAEVLFHDFGCYYSFDDTETPTEWLTAILQFIDEQIRPQ